MHLLKNLILLANQGDSPGQPKMVLACSHNRSLQLLCTVGGSQARLVARTEFKISQRSPKGGVKLVVQMSVIALLIILLIILSFIKRVLF